MTTYDVIIIGAGPSGSTLAYWLAQSGASVCIIDKENFPRKKVCAGGLPIRTLELIPFDFSSVIENEITSAVITHRLKGSFQKEYLKPLIYTVSREKFDNFLLKKAIEAGVLFLGGKKIEDLTLKGDACQVIIDGKIITAKVLVGADGANSFVSKKIGLDPIDSRHVAIQIEVPLEKFEKACLMDKKTIALDWGGSLKDGYAWIFPNGKFVSVGVEGPHKLGRETKIYFDNWVKLLNLNVNEFVITAHNIPHRTTESRITKGATLLVGDAAGMADYWTGEGIYYGIKSSQIAAQQIQKYLKGDERAIKNYEALINKLILPEAKASYFLSRIFNYFSFPAFWVVKEYEYPWDAFCRVMRGDKTFVDIKEKLFFWR